MKTLILKFPDDHCIIIEVKDINLSDDGVLSINYNVTNTESKAVIDNAAVDSYMKKWLSDFINNIVDSD